jgi:predicted TIM-barrel fold metal-dependent hydrolase
MIIDCHTHIGRNVNITATVAELLKSMDASKIDKSLVFAGALNACPTDYMLEQIAPHTDRLLGVAGVHPFEGGHSGSAKEQMDLLEEQYLTGKIVAVKFYLGYDHYYPHQIGFWLARLSHIGCPVIFHCGDCLNTVKKAKLKYAHPLGVDDVAVDYPGSNYIIAHMGYPWHRDTAEVCYKNDNVFTDISGFVYKDFTSQDRTKFNKVLGEFLDIASTDKLLFGTDWPISNQDSYIETLQRLSENTTNKQVSEAFTLQVLTQNIIRAYKL